MPKEKQKNAWKAYRVPTETKKSKIKGFVVVLLIALIIALKFIPFKNSENTIKSVSENSTDYLEMFSEIGEVISRHTKGKETFSPPINSVITSPFGKRNNPLSGEEEIHTGIDYDAPMSSNVYAAKSGEVTRVEENQFYGKFIMVKHDEKTETLYGHLEEQIAQIGDVVKSGQIIAKSGSSGNSTGPHLHFEIRVDKKPVNPEDYLK